MSWIGLVIIVLLAWAVVIAYFVNEKSRRIVVWLLWDFSGARFVWEKICPPVDGPSSRRPAATFTIWALGFLGIYIAIFGLASQRYENRIDVIENRTNAIIPQLTYRKSEVRRGALNEISRIQNMRCPLKPDFLKPLSVVESFYKECEYGEMVEMLTEIVESWKSELNSINLSKAILIEANLESASLNNTNLRGAKLDKANLRSAAIVRANLFEASLVDANLENADFSGGLFLTLDLITDRRRTNLRKSNLKGAVLTRADMRYADLREAYGLTVEQLSKARSLYGSALPSALYEKLRRQYPQLLGPCFTNSSDPQEHIRPNMDFSWGQFQGYSFREVNFEGVNLEYADFTTSRNLDVNQICKAKSLYRAKFDPEFEEQLKGTCPHLLEEPK